MGRNSTDISSKYAASEIHNRMNLIADADVAHDMVARAECACASFTEAVPMLNKLEMRVLFRFKERRMNAASPLST